MLEGDTTYLGPLSYRGMTDVAEEQNPMPDHRIVRSITTLVGLFALLTLATADVAAQRIVRADSLRQIQSVVPMSGPAGTQISVSSDNLPLAARVHIAVGMLHAGFETIGQAAQGEFGEISASVQIPAAATWDRPLYVIALDGVFSPIGISDPFHVTDADGMIRRAGRVIDEGGQCLALLDDNGLLYALAGELGGFRPGDEVLVDGTYSGSSGCRDGSTIAVARIVAR
jgi:hypothetical protein